MPKKSSKKPVTTRKQKRAVLRAIPNTSSASNSASNPGKFEYLPSPVKSLGDENEYRVIRLANGLTATLILRPKVLTKEQPQGTDEVEDHNEMENDFEWYQTMTPQDESIFPETTCKLCINVGSFSDPLNVPGTSEILSSILCKGSKKYPQDDDFAAFIRINKGFHVTYTRCETTSFYFEIRDKFLRHAFDRFVQFFIAPLLTRKSIIHARNTILAEYISNSHCFENPNKQQHLFGSIGTVGSPVRVFDEFYLEPLKDVSSDVIQREVLKFRKNHYTTDRMTLVITSRLPLDLVENYVKEYFSKIPEKSSPINEPNPFNFKNCFMKQNFNKVFYMKPAFDDVYSKTLALSWSIPPQRKYYRSKPHKYLAWMLNSSGHGSLFSYLRKNGWCVNLLSSFDNRCLTNNSIYTLFTIALALTDKGFRNRKQIVDAVFSYLNLMRDQEPERWIFDEICAVERAKFKFSNQSGRFGPLNDLCEYMHLYPSEDYLTGNILSFEYDPSLIEECMKLLTPERVNIIVLDENFTDRIVQTTWVGDENDARVYFERIYHAGYNLPQEWIENWKTMKPYSEFKLPKENAFIADDFALVPTNMQMSRCPVKIQEDQLTEVWYMADSKFRFPEAYIIYHYICPVSRDSLENSAMFDLFVTALKTSLIERLYPATIAGLKYDIRSSERGLEIHVNGFNQKLLLLMETITKQIAQFAETISPLSFEGMKEEQLEAYLDIFYNASKLAEDIHLSILRPGHWTSVERHAVIADLELDTFKHFTTHFTDQMHMQCFAQGNVEASAIIENVAKCVDILNLKPTPTRNLLSTEILTIPHGPRCCRVQGFDDNDWVQNYYQFDISSCRVSVIIDLLMIILKGSLYRDNTIIKNWNDWDFYVSKRVRGYSVALKPYHRDVTNEIICGDKIIEEFRELVNETLVDSKDSEWRSVKKVLAKFKGEASKTLRNEVKQNWREIVSGEYIFDRNEIELKAMNDLQVKDLREHLSTLLTEGPHCHKLSIQVVGQNLSQPAPETTGNTHHYCLQYLPVASEEKNDYYITDVNAFKRELQLFPEEEKKNAEINKD